MLNSHSYRYRYSFITALFLAIALLGGRPAAARLDGTVSGRVTNSTNGQGLANTVIRFYEESADDFVAMATTDGNGDYSLSVPPGNYAMKTENTQGFINEIRGLNGNIPCSAVCDTSSVAFFPVTTNPVPDMDFPLEPGGRMAGTVTATGGQPLAGVRVYFADPVDGFPFTWGTTDINGQFLSEGGTVTGTVYAFTGNQIGYQDELFDNVKCLNCDFQTLGTQIAVTIGVTTGGINFALDPGGSIAGTVTNSSGAGVPLAEVMVLDSTGDLVAEVDPDSSGNYVTGGLPAGTYYVGTRRSGLVDEFYNNVTCVGGFCDPTLPGGGTPIVVTVGATVSGIDFSLATGGTIRGTVTNAAGGAPLEDIFVGFFNAANQYLGGAQTNSSGVFQAVVPPGIVFAGVFNQQGFASQMYNGFPCLANCLVSNSTGIFITPGTTTSGIDFALSQGASISGRVTNTGGTGVVTQVQVLTNSGTLVGNVTTNANGDYAFAGLLAGSYYVRTNTGSNLINELYNDIVCTGCNPVSLGGTLIPTAPGTPATNINFVLATGGRISGTIRNADTNATLPGVSAQIFTASGQAMGTVVTNGVGVYTTHGLPAGSYVIRTANNLGFINELYNDILCPITGCTLTNGAPIAVTVGVTTSNIDFNLSPGGRISGTITSDTGIPMTFSSAVIYNEAGVVMGQAFTNVVGAYTSAGLPAGTYFLRSLSPSGFVDELYDNIPCASCNFQMGTPVVVTGTATTSNINFVLSQGGTFAGTVTDANTAAPLSGVSVQIYSQTGEFLRAQATNSSGAYTVSGLVPGTYYARTAVGGGTYYFDELYNEIPCAPTCNPVTSGAGIAVTAGGTVNGVNFTLTPGGGGIVGTVTDAVTNGALSVTVEVYTQAGAFVKQGGSANANGAYSLGGLPAGSYFVRTRATQTGVNYADELYDNGSCLVACVVTTGTPVVVANSTTTPFINFALTPNLIQNSGFSNGAGGWTQFATSTGGTVDPSYIEWNVTNGVANFRRVPQTPGNPVNQAVMLRATGLPVGANQALLATFDIGNSSAQAKYMKVLVHDQDFSDLAACTFQFEPNAPIRRFQMLLHTTEAWTSATIAFYASSPRTDAGYYQLDNVFLQTAPAGSSIERTDCIDPLAPVPPGGADGPELLTNGSFSAGMASWNPLGTVSVRTPMVAETLEILRPSSTPPPGVVLQATTGQDMTQSQILTLTLRLGNATASRKRALLIVHALNFSDLIACTWWLPAGQPLSTYKMIVYASRPWTVASGANASVSIYPSIISAADQWIQVDDVSLMRTPSAVTPGTRCLEGTEAAEVAPPAASSAVVGAGLASAPAMAPPAAPRDGQSVADAPWTQTGDGWMAVADESLPRILRGSDLIDLRDASEARLTFHSWLRSLGSAATVEVSADGVSWTDVGQVGASDGWQPVDVDLGAFLGQLLEVRFVLHGVRWSALEAPDVWHVRGVRVQVRDR